MEADRRQARTDVLTAALRQLELFSEGGLPDAPLATAADSDRIAQYLSSRAGRAVEVIFTDNTSTMITVNRSPACRVRLHCMFAGAPREVLNALAVYVKWPGHKKSNATLSRYINENNHLVRMRAPRPERLKTRGRHFDLKVLCNRLNGTYFSGMLKAPITWGRPFRGRRRRQVTFGCVDHRAGVIRINPALDAQFVPDYFIEYIVYHEMLHCLIETRTSAGGRTQTHHSDFRKRERQYSRYSDAVRWEKENLHRFLGRRGR